MTSCRFYNLEVFGEVGVLCAVRDVHMMIGVGDNVVEVVTSLCGIWRNGDDEWRCRADGVFEFIFEFDTYLRCLISWPW